MSKRKLDQSRVEEATIRYAILQQRKKQIDAKFNEVKKKYYSLMNDAYDQGVFGDDVASVEFMQTFNYGSDDEHTTMYKATRVQPVKVKFDTKKLKQALVEADVDVDSVIKKRVIVIDYNKLAQYVKSLGGKPRDFKQLLQVDEEVDQRALDNLVEVGAVDRDDLNGTYTTELGNISFRVSVKDSNDGDDD